MRPAVHDDLCTVTDENVRTRHKFTTDTPNRLWLTDITEHKTAEGKLYLLSPHEARPMDPRGVDRGSLEQPSVSAGADSEELGSAVLRAVIV